MGVASRLNKIKQVKSQYHQMSYGAQQDPDNGILQRRINLRYAPTPKKSESKGVRSSFLTETSGE
jgi:hypothetical protein